VCGICGVLDPSGAPVDRQVLERMTASLDHRGPDDRGVHTDGPLGLGHTRLSIIDLSPAGHQPMFSDDGSVVLVYNGEVYNFLELAGELRQKGHVFRGRSDSEVVLHSYLEWGEDCFARLNGMFALALWDGRRRRLLLARDRFGIKPLHYTVDRGGRLLFGSEIKALLAAGNVDVRISRRFLHEYLYYGNSLWNRTAFEGIQRVLPGTYLACDPEGRREVRYWDIGDSPERRGTLEEHAAGVRERLQASVRRHLIADVPVAVFLSGGIDSSAIATYAAREVGERLRTYTAGFDQGFDLDERPRARRLAEHLGTEHHELFVRVRDLPDVLEVLARAHDEPFADAANVPLYLMCRELQNEGVKVVLQGDGGDEIFAGYRRYNVLSHGWFWRAVAPPAIAALAALPESPRRQRALRFLRVFARSDRAGRMARLLTLEDSEEPPTRVLTREGLELLRGTDPFAAYDEVTSAFASRDEVQAMLYTDCMLLLPDTFLAKVDRPTMSCSIEVRVPFLDAELTDYVLPIPSSHKVRRFQKKFLLRRALRGVVPEEILDGPKRGLEVPYQRWLRTELRDWARAVLLDPGTDASGLFDRAALERCLDQHAGAERDNGFLLYKLLNLVLWMRLYRPAQPLSQL
jgi:asparagine synthase (glutamine-hydrolysing)